MAEWGVQVSKEGLAIADRLRRAPRTLADFIEKNLRSLGGTLVRAMRSELSVVRYTGETERSVSVEYTAAPPLYTLKVGPTAKQREVIRTGARPHYAPIGPLKKWAQWKLGDETLAYPIQKSIARYGTSRYLERKGIGERVAGHGIGLNYPDRTLARGDAKLALDRTGQRLSADIVNGLDGKA